ncbi:MAG: hypothetical protein ABIQ06_12600, partial [Caldimonas sp.]
MSGPAKEEWLALVLGVKLPARAVAPVTTAAKVDPKAAKAAPNVANALEDAGRLGLEPDDDPGTVGAGNAADPASANLVGADARPQTTVTLHNFTGSALRLLDARLRLRTARFVPAAPPLIAPLAKARFQVVESTIGANGGGATLRYHIERRRQDVNVVFAWEGVKADITFEGKSSGPFSTASDAVQDSETGNRYDLLVKDFADPDPLEV